MIQFTCTGCGREFAVPPSFAGRTANCKTCGTPLVVPPASTAPSAPAPGTETSPVAADASRTRRLQADARRMAESFAGSPLIKVRSLEGDPPEAYQVEYAIRGLERGKGNRPVPREQHLVEIRLPGDYPAAAPRCRMLTPIFHPNIDPTTIHLPERWTGAGRLEDLAVRIGEMIAFQAFDLQNPLDAEAAMWADLNPQSLPVDPRPLRAPDA